MGLGSWFQDNIKDPVSDAWEGAKDEITDITGVDSLNTLLATGGLATVPANLSGKGILGEALTSALSPLTQVPQQAPPPGFQGGLNQPAPAMSMGSGSAAPRQSSRNVADLLGPSGYANNDSASTSSALLQTNPEAYQFKLIG